MKDHIFEEILRAERDRPLPTCPSNLEANVLRRVRLAAGETEGVGGFDWVLGLLPQKGLVFGALTVTFFLSLTSTMLVASSSARAAESQNRAVAALDFGIFKETPFLDLEN